MAVRVGSSEGLGLTLRQLAAEATNDDLIDWRRVTFMAEELDVDREKRPLYAIKKRMRAVAG
jgi:hypothetical protein